MRSFLFAAQKGQPYGQGAERAALQSRMKLARQPPHTQVRGGKSGHAVFSLRHP